MTAPTPTGDATVARAGVQLTSWGQEGGVFSASAVVEGVVRDGRCTMTLARGSQRETAVGDSARSAQLDSRSLSPSCSPARGR